MDTLVWFCPLWMGTTEADSKQMGINLPEEIDWFISLVMPRAMLAAVTFSMVADIPSGPLDFVVSIVRAATPALHPQ